jgi:response regulator RpfG family c-di-GMP phosphodiesterase
MKKPKTVLYLDDEPINLHLFEFAFKKEYHIITVESPKEAIKIVEKEKHLSAIISDMKMPEMNGIEFIRIIKKDKPDLPCFILTGYDINKEISDALREKLIEKYFSKPFNVNMIKKAVNEAFQE